MQPRQYHRRSYVFDDALLRLAEDARKLGSKAPHIRYIQDPAAAEDGLQNQNGLSIPVMDQDGTVFAVIQVWNAKWRRRGIAHIHIVFIGTQREVIRILSQTFQITRWRDERTVVPF